MTPSEMLFAYDAAISLVLGLVAGAVLIAAGPRPVTRERAVDVMLGSFLFFSGTVRFLVLFIGDAFFPTLESRADTIGTVTTDALTRLGFAELGIAVLCLFGLRSGVPVRIAVTVPLCVILLGHGLAWLVIGIGAIDAPRDPAPDAIAALVAGAFGLLLLALDWANRSDEPDPLEPGGGKRFTY